MAKGDGKVSSHGSVGSSAEHKVAILKALACLQECHPKGSDLWNDIEKLKKEVENETNEDLLAAKRKILHEEFKKEIDQALETK